MMIYITEHMGYKNSCHELEITEKSVSQDEYMAFYKNFSFYYKFYQIKEIHDICLEEFSDFSKFFSPDHLNEMLRSEDVLEEKVLQIGNKLLLNYCTAIRILVDKIKAYLKNERPDKMQEFEEFCSSTYDNNFPYRFFMRLRNYIMHNSMPFTKMVCSLSEDCNIYMQRDDLLKWKGWSTVKYDLEKMESDIAIQPYLPNIGSLIYAIYLQGLYYMVPDIISSLEKIEEFKNKQNIKSFDFIECEKIEDIEKGAFIYHPVPWKHLTECLEELNKHPNINVHWKENENK